MRLIRDEDKERLEYARQQIARYIGAPDIRLVRHGADAAHRALSIVLDNMEALGQEHPIPAPKIAATE